MDESHAVRQPMSQRRRRCSGARRRSSTPGHTFESVTETISHVVLTKRTPIGWLLGFFIAFVLLMVLNVTIGNLLLTGIGIWGNNIPVGWAFDIINFVWWIGIGHAGTLISAILLLFRQQWRTSINRFAEAMTLFAVAARRCSRCCTPAGRGWPRTGCSRIRTRWTCGRSSAAR